MFNQKLLFWRYNDITDIYRKWFGWFLFVSLSDKIIIVFLCSYSLSADDKMDLLHTIKRMEAKLGGSYQFKVDLKQFVAEAKNIDELVFWN